MGHESCPPSSSPKGGEAFEKTISKQTYGCTTERSVDAECRSSGNYKSNDEEGKGGVHG